MIALRIVEETPFYAPNAQYVAHYCYVVDNFENFRQIVSMTNKYTFKDETIEMSVNGVFYNYAYIDLNDFRPHVLYSDSSHINQSFLDLYEDNQDERSAFMDLNKYRNVHSKIFSTYVNMLDTYPNSGYRKDYLRLWVPGLPIEGGSSASSQYSIVLYVKMYRGIVLNDGRFSIDYYNWNSVIYLHSKVVRVDVIDYNINNNNVFIKNVQSRQFVGSQSNIERYLHIEFIGSEIQVNQITRINKYSAQKIENFEDKYTTVGFGNTAIFSNNKNKIIRQISESKEFDDFFN